MNYYEEITKLKTAKDFVRVLKKWDVLSANLQAGRGVPMVLPDLLWISNSGVGKTHLLQLLSEYLYAKGNLMDFCGNVKYLEFMLDYCKPDQRFSEIERMINELSVAAGFRNVFKGIVSVDIDEWVHHCDEKHFIRFLEYLSGNSDDWLIVFNVTSRDGKNVKQLESVLSMFFRLEKSTFKLPETAEFLQFITDKLSAYQLTLDDSARALLTNTVEKLRENKYFDGYKTLSRLCQDIVYEYFSVRSVSGTVVSAENLKEFAPESKYIERATWKAERKMKIGFIE